MLENLEMSQHIIVTGEGADFNLNVVGQLEFGRVALGSTVEANLHLENTGTLSSKVCTVLLLGWVSCFLH